MNYIKLLTVAYLSCSLISLKAQTKSPVTNKAIVSQKKATALKYESVPNDPYKARIYTLKNGLKVYLSVYKNTPRIQTYIAVRAGSKNDPSQATGLAHYLEHMVFKGTDKFGTKDFVKESKEIKKIEDLYEVYRQTKNEKERKIIYHKIDSISGVAAKYAIANEYDKMIAAIGGEGSNAFTSNDETVYQVDIPNNQLETWLKIESERFRKPILRLFHTELEAVYEEKNIGLDNDGRKVWESLHQGLFKNHTYGTQTTIGTIEHLKNPSMKEINKYYNANYVPNNMAICMSGDFDPDITIKLIEKYFSSYTAKPVAPYTFKQEEPITSKVVKEVVGPDAESVVLAWRFPGINPKTKDGDILKLLDAIMGNGKAGLIDIHLNQAQKVLESSSFTEVLNDYSVHALEGKPKEGQTLEEVEQLLLSQIDKLKNGDFPDWLLQAVINDIKLTMTKQLENNQARAMNMVDAFIGGQKWEYTVNTIERLSKITKQDIIAFANKNYSNTNYCIVYKRIGTDKNIQKVEKPAITPVNVNREEESPFVTQLLAKDPTAIEPKFIDFDKDIIKSTIKSAIPVLYNKNTENETFELYYTFNMGKNNDKILPIAISYIPYLGTSKYTPAQIQEEFYKLGCSFNVLSSDDETQVSLTGLNESFDKAVQLFEQLLSDPKVEELILKNVVNDLLKTREDAKLNKRTILFKALANYAKYGPSNPFTNILTKDQLEKITVDDIIYKLKSLSSYSHNVLYYGPKSLDDLKMTLNAYHNVPSSLKPVPSPIEFKEQATTNKVYVVDYDMKQVEIVMLAKGGVFNSSITPQQTLYNEYFGGSMGSIVFQELRESKALAYSTYSGYQAPIKKDQSYYNLSYIGSQSDKLADAMQGLSDLLNNMPASENLFEAAKDAVIQNIRTQRINKADILFYYEESKKLGLNNDPKKDVFENATKMTFNDIKSFQENYIKGQSNTTVILGKKELLDKSTLEKYGTITHLTLQEVFGY